MGMLSLFEAAAIFTEIAVKMDHIEHHCLDEGSKILQDEAQRVLGTYDYGWPQLAASTQRAREAHGDTPNEPLLVTGELRDSIERVVQTGWTQTVGSTKGGVAYVGSNNDKAIWHELGTSRIPPRPFLTTAANAKHSEIGDMIGGNFHALLVKG